MAKMVILAHPFERISGNVTRSKQALVYAENDNPAWEAPHSRQYARNFKPQMNLRYDAKSGKTSFTIQTKASVDNTELGRLRMARFGGMQAIVNGIKKNPTLLANIYDRYATVKDNFKSFDSYLAQAAAKAVKEKSATVNYTGYPVAGSVVKVNNPWVAGGTGTDVTISDEVLQKFAEYLCPRVIVVDGKVVAGINIDDSEDVETWLASKFNDGSFAKGSAEGGGVGGKQILYKGEPLYILKEGDYYGDSLGASNTFGSTLPYSTTAPNA